MFIIIDRRKKKQCVEIKSNSFYTKLSYIGKVLTMFRHLGVVYFLTFNGEIFAFNRKQSRNLLVNSIDYLQSMRDIKNFRMTTETDSTSWPIFISPTHGSYMPVICEKKTDSCKTIEFYWSRIEVPQKPKSILPELKNANISYSFSASYSSYIGTATKCSGLNLRVGIQWIYSPILSICNETKTYFIRYIPQYEKHFKFPRYDSQFIN